jgi:hypothetical protein
MYGFGGRQIPLLWRIGIREAIIKFPFEATNMVVCRFEIANKNIRNLWKSLEIFHMQSGTVLTNRV